MDEEHAKVSGEHEGEGGVSNQGVVGHVPITPSASRQPLQASTHVPDPHNLPPHLSDGRRCRASPRSGRPTPLQACTHVQSPHKPPPHLRGDRRRREAAAGTCERPRREEERGGREREGRGEEMRVS